MASPDSPGEFDISTTDLSSVVQDRGFFRSLVENGSDAIVSIDENSTIIYANQSVERVFGYDPGELIGERLTKLMPQRFQSDHFEAVDRYLDTGERQLDWNDIRLPAERKDGEEVPLSITFEEHSYEGQRVFSGIMRDVSDREQRQNELERQNERLERFASIVSHDLREPLQTARATLAVAKAGNREALDDLDDVFDRMDDLIEDVLTLAKQGRTVGDARAVDVGEVAGDAWSTASEGDATIVTADALPTVAADPERLRTLFENLFRNAIEHGSSDVTVSVERLQDGDGFAVTDDGDGFADADIDRLFEYGYTTNEDGTGFGLNIVKQVVEAHGWEVTATTTAAGGARFEIYTQ